jgi:predicted ATPase
MLKEVRFKDWKSFRNATLFIDPLTVLVGTNASGKSNALDGIAFLSRAAQGHNLASALTGGASALADTTANPIRGGVEWAAMKPGKTFTLEARLEGPDQTDYEYSLTVRTMPQIEVASESLSQASGRRIRLFEANAEGEGAPGIPATLYNGRGQRRRFEFRNSVSIISQVVGKEVRQEIVRGAEAVISVLASVFILDPVPTLMRSYSPLSTQLAHDASNLAGVLAGLPEPEKERIETSLSAYVSRLPEGEVQKVWAEPAGRFKTDAMLYCTESWAKGYPLEVDARGMSDGTLRFLAILTALLTRPRRTLIVIEEVDNGLHPSRTKLLLHVLREIGAKREIDVLITTHNPALLDQLGPEMTPFVVFAHRSPETGESLLTLLEDVANLPKLLALGPLGALTTRGYIEQGLAGDWGTVHES